uniref:Uncharacterized protein n=1 Tax=Rhabditophanes sp. KR3021 TaxID=114890 RepID=A0AC35TYP8_9BILA
MHSIFKEMSFKNGNRQEIEKTRNLRPNSHFIESFARLGDHILRPDQDIFAKTRGNMGVLFSTLYSFERALKTVINGTKPRNQSTSEKAETAYVPTIEEAETAITTNEEASIDITTPEYLSIEPYGLKPNKQRMKIDQSFTNPFIILSSF